MKRKLMRGLAATVLAGTMGVAIAQAEPQTAQEPIYGSQLMTPSERDEYHNRMRAAQTEQEREKIRAEHHKQMQAWAKEHGLTLPDELPMAHGGMGPTGGKGMGHGMGHGGGGMGSGSAARETP